MLALFQRDGRLVDFLFEDIAAYTDAQIGAAVRDVHAAAAGVLERYVTLEPILPDQEGEPTTVAADVDPAAVHLVGNVRASRRSRHAAATAAGASTGVELPPLADSAAPREVVAPPAEVEIG